MYRCMNPQAIGIALGWEECLPLAREGGFEGMDLSIDPSIPASTYREALARHGLKPGGMGLPVDPRGSKEKYETGLAELPRIASRAAEVGVTRFPTWIPSFSDTMPWEQRFALLVDRLGPVARILSEHGCSLGLEFLGPRTLREGRKHSFIHTLHGMLELCRAVGPNAGLLLDAYHWYTSLGTVEELEELGDEQITYVHINDAPAGVPMEQQQDLVRRIQGESGVIDLGAFLGALRRIGYSGPVVPEPFVKELCTMPPADAARRVGNALQRVWSLSPRPRLPAQMKAVATGRGKAWLVDLPVPRPEGNQVVVKLLSSPICGSNMGSFHGEGEWVNTGHEGAGEVVAVAHSTMLEPGMRVALAPLGGCGRCEHCRAGDTIFCANKPPVHGYFAQYAKVADVACTPLPDDIDEDTGSLLGCCLGPAYSAIKGLGLTAVDTVAVSGLGPVGLGAVAVASFFGARVIAIDPVRFRRDLAERLGAREVLDSADGLREKLLHATGGRGVPKAIECSGKAEAERLLLDCASIRGRIAIVGENQLTIPVSPSKDFIRKGLTLFGCWHMNVLWAPELFGFLRDPRAQMLISHRFGFADVQKAFDTFASRESAKVILKPWE